MEFLVDIKNMMMPELVIITGVLALCFLSLFYQRAKQSAYILAISVLILAFGFGFSVDTHSACTAFYGAFLSSKFTVFFKGMILIGSVFTVLLSDKYIKTLNKNVCEFYMLLLTAVLGSMILVSSNDLITLFIGLETLGIASYILSGFIKGNKTSSETAMKYLITGAVASAVLLYGFSFLYGVSGSLQFEYIKEAFMNPAFFHVGILAGTLVISGLCFKLASLPFYNWASDVYQGSPLSVSAFLSVVSKIAGFGIFIRVMSEFLGSIWILYVVVFLFAIATMTIGNFLAVRENNIKRLMAYSSIAHAGYMLAALSLGATFSISSVIFYLITYVFMNFAAWGCIETIDKTPNTTIDDFKGLAYKHPFVAGALTVSLVSLAGLPVCVGFFSKFYLIQTISFAGFALFPAVLIILFNSLVALFYYFKVVKSMFEKQDPVSEVVMSKRLKSLLVITTAFTLFAGIVSGPIIEYSQSVAQAQLPIMINYDELNDGFINSIENQ